MIAKRNAPDVEKKKLPAADKRKLWLQFFGFMLLDNQTSLNATWSLLHSVVSE